MGKLSQKELLNDGFGSLVSGLARTTGKALAGTARALAPETSAALGKGAALAAGAIQNVQSGNPTAAATEFVKSQEGRRFFKNGKVKFGKEQKLPNNDIKIPIVSGIYLVNQGGGNVEERNLEGGHIVLRRTKQPGMNGFTNNVTDVVDGQGNKLNNGILGSRKSQQAQPATPQAQPTAEEPKAEEPAPQAEEPQQEEPTAEEPQAEEPTPEEPTAEEPTAEEPTAEEPQAEEPQQDQPFKMSDDEIAAAYAIAQKAGGLRTAEDRLVISDFKKYLETNYTQNNKAQTIADILRDPERADSTTTLNFANGKFNREILRKLFESKNSQKNTLKHLQSVLRENKWTIGQ